MVKIHSPLKDSKIYDCVFQIFEKFMLDSEWSINAGCWMWLSCSAFFAKHPQWMCPVGLGEHLDPQGSYVRYGPRETGVPAS